MSENKEKGIKTNTAVFMIAVALFFDFLQFILSFIYLGWLVGIFAGLTFYLWFKTHGISFMKPKRAGAFGGAALIEMIPIPFLAAIPAWTAAVAYLALESKIQATVPGADITKLGIGNVTANKNPLPQRNVGADVRGDNAPDSRPRRNFDLEKKPIQTNTPPGKVLPFQPRNSSVPSTEDISKAA